jgi:hypothetical protein
LVASGFVPEAQREELETYLAARRRFLSNFGTRSNAREALDELARTVRMTADHADRCQSEVQAFVAQIKTAVLPDLEALLRIEPKRLRDIASAVEDLSLVHVSASDVEVLMARVAAARRTHDEVQQLLNEVRLKLSSE